MRSSRFWPAMGLAAAIAAGSLHAQPVASSALDALSTKVAQQGSGRVIVGLNVATQAEAGLSASAAAEQRSRIGTAQGNVKKMLAGTGMRPKADFRFIPFMALEVDANALARLKASPMVRSIEEDVAEPPTLVQSVPLVNAPAAWSAGLTGNGWAVAVLDTGVQKTHPFLAGKVVSEACYSSTVDLTGSVNDSLSVCPGGVASSTAAGSGVNCTPIPSECEHGTHVAGIAAGTNGPSSEHGVGRGANIVAVQVFSYFPGQPAGRQILSYISDQLLGLERVLALSGTMNIAAVNMSLGGGNFSSTAACDAAQGARKAAIDNLRAAGIATVASSGNSGFTTSMGAPACISSAISVGATCDAGPDADRCGTGVDGVASYSNIASFISLVAPGSYIVSSIPTDSYATKNGTSMAAPHVAGAFSILKQSNPVLSVTDALTLLRTNAVSVNDTRLSGSVTNLRRLNLAFLGSVMLNVSKAGAGSGSVNSNPAGIDCGPTCSASYASGTSVTLSASAASGSVFAGWSGAGCSGTGSCTVAMTEARSVTATFNLATFALTVTKSGSGSVTSNPAGIDCGATCSTNFASGASVTLSATPAAGQVFTGWGGACSGTGSCTVSMTQARSVSASFQQGYRLTVSKAPGSGGDGTVTSTPAGISCGTSCSALFIAGQSVTLTAAPAPGSVFGGWTGASCPSSGNTCTIVFKTANLSVGVRFNSSR